MNRTAVLTTQTIWDCKSSRPGYRLTGIAEHSQPEPIWVCVRGGERRTVADGECESCPHWVEEEVTPCP